MAGGKVRVYLAVSLDGCIAGPDDDLSWLHDGAGEAASIDPGALQFDAFLADIGVMLMGRRTYDVVVGSGWSWAYGATPVWVPTHRALEPVVPTVRAVAGPVADLLDEALAAAAGKDVYVDGGDLVRQALDAGRVDELVLTVVPVILGDGIRLFEGVARRSDWIVTGHHRYGRMVQIQLGKAPPIVATHDDADGLRGSTGP